MCVKWSISIWIYTYLSCYHSFFSLHIHMGSFFHLPKNFLCGSSGSGFSQGFLFFGFFSSENIFIPPIFLKDIFTEFRILNWQISFGPLMISFHGCSVISVERELSVLLLWRWYVFIPGTAFQIYSLSLVLSNNVPRYGSPAWDLVNILNFSLMSFDNFRKFLGSVTSDTASALSLFSFCDSNYMEVGLFVSPCLICLLVTFLCFHPLVLPSCFDLDIFCWLFS